MLPLFPHQIKYIETAPDRYGLWHDVGTMKTRTCIELAKKRLLLNQPILIITTKSLVNNWKREIETWEATHLNTTIISKEQFKKLQPTLPKYDMIIIDEAHTFAGMTSGFYKNMIKFLKKTNPRYVYLATATPIMASVWSVWALSSLLGSPVMGYGSFRSKYHFNIRMGGREIPVQRKNIEEDIAADLRKFGSVVSKDESLDLPDALHQTEYFTLTKEQIKVIESLDDDPTTVTPIVYLTKKLQIASGTLKQPDGSSIHIKCDKLDRALEIVEQNPNCVIVARHQAELELLHKHIKNSYVYNGKTSIENRDFAIKEVNSGKGVLLLQADMGIGFNLTGVNLMVFYSHTWDYIKQYQCLGRIHRQGQVRPCTYIHLITQDSPDVNVYKCLERKESFDVELYMRNKD